MMSGNSSGGGSTVPKEAPRKHLPGQPPKSLGAQPRLVSSNVPTHSATTTDDDAGKNRRTKKSSTLKDVPSSTSTLSSQTVTSRTEDMSSNYSFSQASAVSNNKKNKNINNHSSKIGDFYYSQPRHDGDDGSSSMVAGSDVSTSAFHGSQHSLVLTTQSNNNNNNNNNSAAGHANTSRRRSAHSRRASLNASYSSAGSSRSSVSMEVKSPRRDAARVVSKPKARVREEDEDDEEDIVLDEETGFGADGKKFSQDNGKGVQSPSHPRGGKVTKSSHKHKPINNANRKPNSTHENHKEPTKKQQPQQSSALPPKKKHLPSTQQAKKSKKRSRKGPSLHSEATSTFDASYGSLSLGGGSSLSSSDTFRESPSPAPSTQKGKVHKPNLAAKPKKTILKPNPNPNPVKPRQSRYYSSDEESQESTRSYCLDPSSSDSEKQAVEASKPAVSPVDSKPHSLSADSKSPGSVWDESLNSRSPEGASGIERRRSSEQGSTGSGEITIATYSDENIGEDSRSLPSCPPVYRPGDSLQTDTDREKGSEISSKDGSFMFTSSTTNNNPKSFLLTGSSTGNSIALSNDSRNQGQPQSPWSSNGNWEQPQSSSDHWASQVSWADQYGGVAAWTSGDDSSFSDDDKDDLSHPSIARKRGKKTDKSNQPRSAYDKNAPWYCGDDSDEGVDSINSDTSSILSNLKHKDNNKAGGRIEAPFEPKASDASMSFADLVKPLSMSLSDSGDASVPDPAQAQGPVESSMSFADLLKSKQNGIATNEQQPCIQSTRAVPPKTAPPKDSETQLRELDREVSEMEEGVEMQLDESSEAHSSEGHSEGWKAMLLNTTKIFDSDWIRKGLVIGLILFLIFDIALAIALLADK